MRRVALAALPLALTALVAACVAQEAEPPAASTPLADVAPPPTAAAATPAALTVPALLRTPPATRLPDTRVNELMRAAVCWYEDPALARSCLPPGPGVLDAVAEMESSEDIRLIVPLIDMLWLDLGWGPAIEDALEALTGERLGSPAAWYDWSEGRIPPPVSRIYGEWKGRLLSLTATPTTAPRFEMLIVETALGGQPGLLVWTGVQPNGTPPLTEPATAHRLEERFLEPSDVIYGLVIGDEARAYPRRIVAWHGAVNDVLGGTPILLSHCLPCGGAVAFDRRVEGETLTFGNAGLAFQSRTLLFDEQTLALWDAFSGQAMSGDGHQGLPPSEPPNAQLRLLPLVTTTWGAWSQIHPNTGVITLDTGYVRDYSAGAAIAEERATSTPLYPVRLAAGLPAEEPVLGIELASARKAYPVAALEARGVVHDLLGETPIVLLSRGAGLGVRAYEASGLEIARLDVEGDTLVAVDAAGERWFVNERALVSTLDGRERVRIAARQGYWFAWSGAVGETALWEANP